MSPSSAGKRAREQAKREKAEAKRLRHQAGPAPAEQGSDRADHRPEESVPTEELLRRIEEVHQLHEDGRISDDDFQATKADLLGRLRID